MLIAERKGTLVETILSLEKRAWEAAKSHDAEFYRELLTDDCIVVGAEGMFDREAAVHGIATRPTTYLSYDIEEPRLLRLSDESALIAYRATVDAISEGRRVRYGVRAASVYVYSGVTWRLAFHQQTPAR